MVDLEAQLRSSTETQRQLLEILKQEENRREKKKRDKIRRSDGSTARSTDALDNSGSFEMQLRPFGRFGPDDVVMLASSQDDGRARPKSRGTSKSRSKRTASSGSHE